MYGLLLRFSHPLPKPTPTYYHLHYAYYHISYLPTTIYHPTVRLLPYTSYLLSAPSTGNMFLQFILVPPNLYEEDSTPSNFYYYPTDVSMCPSKKSGLASSGVIMNKASSTKNLKLYITITLPVDTQPTKATIHIKNSPDCAQSHTNDTLRLLRISWLIHKKAQFHLINTRRKLSLHWNYVSRHLLSALKYLYISPIPIYISQYPTALSIADLIAAYLSCLCGVCRDLSDF